MTTSTKTKSASAPATTVTTTKTLTSALTQPLAKPLTTPLSKEVQNVKETVTLTVASVDNGAKNGKFVRFVANQRNIQWQVYMTDAKVMAHKINEGSKLTVLASSIKIADAYDTVNKRPMLDKDGNTFPSPVVYGWVNAEGETVEYAYGKGTLDIGIKIVKNETNPNIGEAQAKSAFDPLA